MCRSDLLMMITDMDSLKEKKRIDDNETNKSSRYGLYAESVLLKQRAMYHNVEDK